MAKFRNGSLVLTQTQTIIQGSNTVLDGAKKGFLSAIQLDVGTSINSFSIDGAFVSNSDTIVPTQKAIKTYVDAAISGLSPNKIWQLDTKVEVTDSGSNGKIVFVKDGTQVFQVGSKAANAFYSGTVDPTNTTRLNYDGYFYVNRLYASGMYVAGSQVTDISIDGTLAPNSDTILSSQKAVKTYVDTSIAGLNPSKIYQLDSKVEVTDTGSNGVIVFNTDGVERARLDSNLMVTGNATITGDLTVQGNNFVANTQTVLIEDNLLVINKNEVGAGVTAVEAGIEVERGSVPNYFFLFNETSDTFRVGMSGTTQAVATREDSPVSGGVATWNATSFRFDTVAVGTAFNKNYGTIIGTTCQGNDARLSNARAPIAHDNSYHLATYITAADNCAGATNVLGGTVSATTGSFSGDITFTNGRKGLVGVYNSEQTQAVFAMGASYVLPSGGLPSNYGAFYGIGWSYSSVTNPQSKTGLGHQALVMTNGITQTAIGTGIWTIGNITATGYVIGNKVYNAVWNDISDFQDLADDVFTPGKCYYDSSDGAKICNTRCQKSVIGIASDTYGFGVGQTDEENKKQVPIAVCGWVLAYVNDYQNCELGDALTNDSNGNLVKMTDEEKCKYPERIVAIYKKHDHEEYFGTKENKIKINERHWVKVK